MCGRAAQTYHVVQAAAADLLGGGEEASNDDSAANGSINTASKTDAAAETTPSEQERDNYNMSPGMDAFVFWKDDRDQEIRMERKTWGLVTKGGTPNSPLPENDMSRHFSNLMFNARSDTLFAKPTFARLANSRKTCLIALDGFFEWKTELGKKQPYFVYRKKAHQNSEITDETHGRPYMLFAGLWTSVRTGRADNSMLDTFTILTTEACAALQWLHSRMPVAIWDLQLAHKWLDEPSASTLAQVDQAARRADKSMLHWHAVSSQMSSMKYRTADAIKPIPQTKSVKSYFTAAAGKTTQQQTATKMTASNATQSTAGTKRPGKPQQSPSSNKKTTAKKPKVTTPARQGPMDAFLKKRK